MYRVGIDVGSSYTKYCVMGEPGTEPSLFLEQTPFAQRAYFAGKLAKLRETYGEISIVSCGYGKKNVAGMRSVNELTALAKGMPGGGAWELSVSGGVRAAGRGR